MDNSTHMRVLGIETSCDETGVAVYDTAAGLRAHAVYSQIDLHAEYGGVVPELASRDHVRKLLPMIRQTLAEAGMTPADLDGVGYTAGPGLVGALLVGAGVARALAWALEVPAIGVHHMEGHLLAPLMGEDPPAPPFVALLVSGGHTQLVHVAGVGQYRLLGETLDDAAGEAFDKTAKLMGLPYPGGPQLAKLAEAGRPGAFAFARPMTDRPGLDFSFSGLKTQVLLAWRQSDQSAQTRADIARGFEDAVVDTLAIKCERALDAAGCDTLIVAGGVGANTRLREKLRAMAARRPRGVSAACAVHRQRRDDCLRRGAATCRRSARRSDGARATALGHERAAGGIDAAAHDPACPGSSTLTRRAIATTTVMDTVFIEALEIECVIGIYDWERGIRQKVVLDIEMAFDNRAPAATDAIADTLDYKAVSKRMIGFVSASQFGLVETLAERCAAIIREEFQVPWLRLKLSKPGAVTGARAVGVVIERGARPA